MKFHIGINVADLSASVDFYRALTGLPPAKHHDDYAKFEMADPPLVLSLIPSPQLPGGTLNHLGLCVVDSAALVEVQHRLELAGITTEREEGVECCYARQTKFWVTDPDRNLWEIYTFEGDIDHHGLHSAPEPSKTNKDGSPPQSIWQHRLFDPLPARIPALDDSVDEVQLEGTYNARSEAAARRQLLAETLRILRPGGRVVVHGLVSSQPITGPTPDLPGLAALVQHIPVETEAANELAAAGFDQIVFAELKPIHCFAVAGVELREQRLFAHKPVAYEGSSTSTVESHTTHDRQLATVVYRGPLAEVADEQGHVYSRGKRVPVDPQVAHALRSSAVADCFAFLSD